MSAPLTEKEIREFYYPRAFGLRERPVCKEKCKCLDCEARVMHMLTKDEFYSLSDYEKRLIT